VIGDGAPSLYMKTNQMQKNVPVLTPLIPKLGVTSANAVDNAKRAGFSRKMQPADERE